MSIIHHPTSYQVIPQDDQIPPHLTTCKDLVLAWARHRATGEPRYIGELRREETGQKCGCECYSCGLELKAVNAGKTDFATRPHFRHPNGAPKHNCLVLSARAAALQILLRNGELHLPRRRRLGKIEGLSGQYYQAWVTAPRESVRIANFHLEDRVNALVTLDDGRQLKLSMVGSVEATSQEDNVVAITPTIRLIVDDPAIGELSPEELRKRLTLIIDDGCWCLHWLDQQLEAQALAEATREAADALDWLGADIGLPEGISSELKRETLLHIKAKEILEREKRIRLPSLCVTSRQELPSGTVIEKSRQLEGTIVQLETVALERHLGIVKPDVLATTIATGDWPADTLSIEITVTNAIDEERMERIRAKNLPTLEIDISRMGGIVSFTEFKRLIVEEAAGKRWLHHPWMAKEKARLDVEVQAEAEAAGEIEQRKAAKARKQQALLYLPLPDLKQRYLEAIEAYGGLRAEYYDGDVERDPMPMALALDKVYELGKVLAQGGHPEAVDDFLFIEQGNLLDRLMSIKLNRAVGYKIDTAWQVINAILQEKQPYTQWQTLYLIAIKTYHPTLNDKQQMRVADWRENVMQSLSRGEQEYVRDEKYDKFLAFLFPEMANRINTPLPGTQNHGKVIDLKWRAIRPEASGYGYGSLAELGFRFHGGRYSLESAIAECSIRRNATWAEIVQAWKAAGLIEGDIAYHQWEKLHPEEARWLFQEPQSEQADMKDDYA